MFRYQLSGKLRKKVAAFDNIWSSHEEEVYPNTSLDENCIELDFQTDQNYYLDLRKIYFALKPKFVMVVFTKL